MSSSPTQEEEGEPTMSPTHQLLLQPLDDNDCLDGLILPPPSLPCLNDKVHMAKPWNIDDLDHVKPGLHTPATTTEPLITWMEILLMGLILLVLFGLFGVGS
jgi:hypothetical protein